MKQKLFFYIILFFIGFVILGDAYIYFVNGEVDRSDYTYHVDLNDKALKAEYIDEIPKLEKDFDLMITAVETEVKSKNSIEYTIFSFKKNWEFIKERLQVSENNEQFDSLISGRRMITIKPLQSLKDANTENTFQVFGSLEDVKKMRSQTIDKYGMSKPIDNDYQNDAVFLVITVWILIMGIIVIFTCFEVRNVKREILIRYLNGCQLNKLILNMMIKNSCIIIMAVILGYLLAMQITEASKFITISVSAVIGLILVTNIINLTLKKMEIKKVFARDQYSLGYKVLLLIMLSVITTMTMLSLTLNVKTIYDAARTVDQKEKWEAFANYDRIGFFFREETDNTNSEKDREYNAKLYNQYIDKNNIYLTFDFANNGSMQRWETDSKYTFIYMNKNAMAQITALSIEKSRLKPDQFYVISGYNKDELLERNVLDPLEHYIGNQEQYEIITIPDNYEILLYDIGVDNLADNYKKNPIIIFDTHSVLFRENDNGQIVSGALIKFGDSGEFDRYIKSIGYENEIYYKNNVGDLYKEKYDEKILLLIINIILSGMLLILFNVTLFTVLKTDFDSRAMEVAIRKILGTSLMKRYKGIFRLLVGSLLIGLALSVMGKFIFPVFNLTFVLIAFCVLIINVAIAVIFFIGNYEKRKISDVLKGGV